MNVTSFDYLLPSRIIFGCGKVQTAGEEAARLGAGRALIVTSAGMIERESLRLLQSALRDAGVDYDLFPSVEPEPPLETLVSCCAAIREKHDLVIGLGGGSVLDVAKKAAADKGRRKVMIPTTAGTGSEVTHESVLKVDGKKQAFVDPGLTPDVALVDPDLAMSMSRRLAASSALDALAHAVECYESKRSNVLVRSIAWQAFQVIKDSFRGAVEGDAECRKAMCLGSLMAGMAFGNSGTTLGHALSYPLSNRGVPHGEAVAAVLPYALEFNGAEAALLTEVRAVTQMSGFRWEPDWDASDMLEEIMQDQRHLSNNPRTVARDDVAAILARLRETQ